MTSEKAFLLEAAHAKHVYKAFEQEPSTMTTQRHSMATAPEPRSAAALGDRLGTVYWRVRMHATLERLEREARRMLQLESELGQFAQEYYRAVGEVSERLAKVEQHLAGLMPTENVHAALPQVMASCDRNEQRRTELKNRYRSLAKEIHPDRAMLTESNGERAGAMHQLNAAYQQGDLAAMLRLEAEMALAECEDVQDFQAFEQALRDIERAADTYASGARELLTSPLNELMLRAMAARLAGWNWIEEVARKLHVALEEKERLAAASSIAAISAWREEVGAGA